MGSQSHVVPFRSSDSGTSAHHLIVGYGELADLIRALDWNSTSLGPIENWSRELIVMVNLTLSAPTPARLLWGSEFILIYNEAYRAFAGSKHPDALGQPASKVWPEAWHVVGPQLEAVFASGQTSCFEKLPVPIARGAEVQTCYLTYSYSPVYEGGSIKGIFGSLLDVTAEVLTASQIIKSETRATRMHESIEDAGIVTDADARITHMNPVAENLTGGRTGDAGERLLSEVFVIVNKETGQLVENPAGNVKRLGTVVGSANHTVFRSHSGAVTPIDNSGAPVENDEGDLTFAREAERERLQREVVRQFSEMQAIYETASVALALIDPVDFRYLRGNPKLAEILHLPIEQILGTPVFDLANDVSGLRDALLTAAAGTPVLGRIIEGTMANSPGVKRAWLVEYIPVFSEQGDVQVIVASSIEITEQKKAQAALMQNEKLAAVGRLSASIAHEINNPLEAVMNCIYLARTDPSISTKVEDYLGTAERELRRVSAITSQALRFHKQSTNPVPMFCQDLIEGGLSIYQGKIVNARIVVEKRKRASHPVTCFEGEIRQVLNNLVSNAIDAMQQSGGRMLLRSREATNWKTHQKGLVLTVADTGPGMSQETVRKIFEAFFTTKGEGGTGLGLWISCEIIKRHGGNLRVRSTCRGVNRGTVFTIFLPFEAVIR